MPLPRERVPYSAIVDRPTLALPGGARIAVWTIVNVEEWVIERPMPRTVLPPPIGQPLLPDLPNWAWHEYGMRVGFWRLLDCCRSSTSRRPSRSTARSAEPTRASRRRRCEAGWEFMGHGYIQRPMHHLEDQRQRSATRSQAIRRFTGKPPRGWESPGLTETYDTIDLLAEAGIEYVADWVLDDQPVPDQDRARPAGLGAVHGRDERHRDDGAAAPSVRGDGCGRGIDQFDRLYEESEKSRASWRSACIRTSPASPHRIGYLERLYEYILQRPGVLMWTGEQIFDWYLEASGGGR